jgi:hypothetical protein
MPLIVAAASASETLDHGTAVVMRLFAAFNRQ